MTFTPLTHVADSLVTAHHLFGGTFDVCIEEACIPNENMTRDHERALAHCAGTAAPMLRLYSWQPWAVSLGAHQREYDMDREACRRKGFELVRRPTGGRAVLHANELTYCIVTPLATPEQPDRTMHDVYRDIHILLLQALHALGATEAAFEKTQADLRAHYRGGAQSVVCFSSSARYEIVWQRHEQGVYKENTSQQGARKLVGSAQRLYTTCSHAADSHAHIPTVLQHGSVLLSAGHEQLADMARVVDEVERETVRRALTEKAATLSEVCGRVVSFAECAEAITQAFACMQAVVAE
jgi:lipoate-protein ligase A